MFRITCLLLISLFCRSAAAFSAVDQSPFVASKQTARTSSSQKTLKNPVGSFHNINKKHGSICTGSSLQLSPQELWSSYNDALEASPLLVKSVTAGVILGAADLAGQSIESLKGEGEITEEDSGVDLARALRFAIFGLVLQAPWNHFYYLLLDGQIPPTEEPFTSTNFVKVVIDQFVQAPIFTVLIFVFLGLLEGKQFESIQKQLQNDYKETLLANWKLWLPATVVNIGFIPPIFRVLYLNGVFFFWSIYLSLVINKKEEV